jgi:hypothetical protein
MNKIQQIHYDKLIKAVGLPPGAAIAQNDLITLSNAPLDEIIKISNCNVKVSMQVKGLSRLILNPKR